ncbi:MAG: intradiol ring-cleavage dioxygenase [Arachnia sp.]
MTHFPEPDITPNGPAYEGRPLVRPDEEVVDQGAGFDIATILSRRGVLSILGLGTVALAACAPAVGSTSAGATSSSGVSASGTSSTASGSLPAGEIPDETAGPYPADGSNDVNGQVVDVLEQSGIVRQDLRTSIGGGDAVAGIPLTFTLAITDMANSDAPFAGVAVYAWHCDAQGRYSMYSDGVQDQTWLRGVQLAGSDGTVTFTSIVPGCYSGRWPHIHFEVYPDEASITDSTNAIATSQLAFPEDMLHVVYEGSDYSGSEQNLSQVTLASDNVFGEDSAALQMATVTGDATSGYTAALTVRVDTTTAPTGGSVPSRGGRR